LLALAFQVFSKCEQGWPETGVTDEIELKMNVMARIIIGLNFGLGYGENRITA